mgnify:CR=1 FL=1
MPETLHKIDTREALLAWLRQPHVHRLRFPPLPRLPSPQWTPWFAAAGLGGALFFAWAFLKIVLILIFPRPGVL